MKRFGIVVAWGTLSLLACGGSEFEAAPVAAAGAGGSSGGAGAAGSSGAGQGGASGAPGKAGGPSGAITCKTALDCPPPAGTCMRAVCSEDRCGAAPAPAGPLGIAAQLPGDCRVVVCDANGTPSEVGDPTDLPADDGNACTTEVCKGLTPSHDASPAGAPCDGAGVCDGKGKCGACKPGARRCAAGGLAECDASGQWGTPSKCAADQPVCSEGACASAVAVSAGGAHTCARLSDGRVRCWGFNDRGQCGAAPSSTPVLTPVAVAGAEGAVGLAAGGGFTCARLAGGVACWGGNDQGQLGDGTTKPRAKAASVSSLGAVDELVAGDHHACVRAGDSVKCWGGNELGQLASATATSAPKPLAVSLAAGATALSAGFGHTCAGAKGKGIWCWGSNDLGQLGRRSSEVKSSTPMLVVEQSVAYQQDYAAVERLFSGPAARHGLAALDPGEIAIWGSNAHGEAGYTSSTNLDGAAYFIDQARAFDAISAGAGFSCTLSGGVVRCNGANDVGQLGRGTVGVAEVNVVEVGAPLPGGVVSVAAGARHACAVAGGDVYCWGANDQGQLGAPSTPSATPRAVTW